MLSIDWSKEYSWWYMLVRFNMLYKGGWCTTYVNPELSHSAKRWLFVMIQHWKPKVINLTISSSMVASNFRRKLFLWPLTVPPVTTLSNWRSFVFSELIDKFVPVFKWWLRADWQHFLSWANVDQIMWCHNLIMCRHQVPMNLTIGNKTVGAGVDC